VRDEFIRSMSLALFRGSLRERLLTGEMASERTRASSYSLERLLSDGISCHVEDLFRLLMIPSTANRRLVRSIPTL
jgi:hypothetical protein